MGTIEITERNFEEVTKKGVVILDFWAQWCAPCLSFAPVFEEAANRHQDIVFGKISTETQPGLARRFGIRAIPTVVVLIDGNVIYTQAGALSALELEDLAMDDLVRLARAGVERVGVGRRRAAGGESSGCCGC